MRRVFRRTAFATLVVPAMLAVFLIVGGPGAVLAQPSGRPCSANPHCTTTTTSTTTSTATSTSTAVTSTTSTTPATDTATSTATTTPQVPPTAPATPTT